jgi:hypothetical protein
MLPQLRLQVIWSRSRSRLESSQAKSVLQLGLTSKSTWVTSSWLNTQNFPKVRRVVYSTKEAISWILMDRDPSAWHPGDICHVSVIFRKTTANEARTPGCAVQNVLWSRLESTWVDLDLSSRAESSQIRVQVDFWSHDSTFWVAATLTWIEAMQSFL